MSDATPETVEPETTGEILANGELKERRGNLLRLIFAAILGVLLVGDVAMYSLHKAMASRVESQERRMDRMNKMLNDSLTARQNATKIEGLETQVDGLVTAVEGLQQMVEDTHPLPKKPSE